MAFTPEDRNLLIATATRVENMGGWIENLPCQQHPPECTQETRIESLETTRTRGVTGMVTTVIGIVVAAVGYIIHRILG